MIQYDQPDDDPIVAEVRRAREEYAARFNFDLRAIFEDVQRRQLASGRESVTLPPRVPNGHLGSSKKAG